MDQRRIDACVRACRDLSTEQLERVTDDFDLYDLFMELRFDESPMKEWLDKPIKHYNIFTLHPEKGHHAEA